MPIFCLMPFQMNCAKVLNHSDVKAEGIFGKQPKSTQKQPLCSIFSTPPTFH